MGSNISATSQKVPPKSPGEQQETLQTTLAWAQLVSTVGSLHELDNAAARRAVRNQDSAEFLSADSLKPTFSRVQKIGTFILDTLESCGVSTDSRLGESPNPFYSQIGANGGLALEMYYGHPSKFWTPLGQKSITGSTCSRGGQMEQAMKIIKERLGLREIVPRSVNEMGEFGPVYQLTKDVDGQPLPPVQLKTRADYLSYEAATAIARKLGEEK